MNRPRRNRRRRGIADRAHHAEQLDDRAGPAVRHDQRQRRAVRRLYVDEVDVDAVDLRLELGRRVSLAWHWRQS